MKQALDLGHLYVLAVLLLSICVLAACVTVYTGAPPTAPASAAGGQAAQKPTEAKVAAATVAPTKANRTAAAATKTPAATKGKGNAATTAPSPSPTPAAATKATPEATATSTVTAPEPAADTPQPTATNTEVPTLTNTPVPPTETPAPAPTDTETAAPKAPDQKGTGRGGAVPNTPTATPIPDAATDKKTAGGGGSANPPTATASPAPHTRTLYSEKMVIGAQLIPLLGGKADPLVNKDKTLSVGCQVVEVNGIDYHWMKPVPPPAQSVNHKDHGFSVTRLSDNPRDLGVKLHIWFNAPSNIWVRVVYTVREDWNVDCSAAGATRLEP